MKSYTDIEQSKKLAEILPPESADMFLAMNGILPVMSKYIDDGLVTADETAIPCWSLVALLDILPFPQLSKDKLGNGKVGWIVSVYPYDCRYDSCWHDNPIDACFEMILKLHELNLL